MSEHQIGRGIFVDITLQFKRPLHTGHVQPGDDAHIAVRQQYLALNVGEASSLWTRRRAPPSTDIALPVAVPDLRLTQASPSQPHARAPSPLPMDIREWLQNTADREPPEEQDDHGFPNFFQPGCDTPPDLQPAHQRRSKRKRAPSESASDDRRHTAEKRRRLVARSPSHARRRAVQSSSSASQSSYSSRSEDSEASPNAREVTETFARRPRHKTRADRYEAKPKKKRKERESRVDKKSKPKKRKTRRRADGARTNGLVHSFQLKNGPKNNRLTLRPHVSTGIFKHGRASAPMASGRPGLPDLVFNEMKFLQRPKEHQDELPSKDAVQQQNKKSRKQMQEEEVSAYFSRKPSTEQTGDARKQDPPLAHSAKKTAISPPMNHRSQHVSEQASKAPVELPDKAFLGFGSRGPAPDKASNSCFTWSESIAPNRPEKAQQLADHSAGKKGSELEDDPHSRQRNAGQESPADFHEHTSGRWVKTNRAKVPRPLHVYQPFDGSARNRESRQSSEEARSTHDPPNDPLSENARSVAPTSARDRKSYRTSDILKIHDVYRDEARSTSLPMQKHIPGSELHVEKENVNPRSTPTSEILRCAFRMATNTQPKAKGESQLSERSESYSQTRDAHQHSEFGKTDNMIEPIWPAEEEVGDHHEPSLPQRGLSRSMESSLTHQGRLPLQNLPPGSAHAWNARQSGATSLRQDSRSTSAQVYGRQRPSYPAPTPATYTQERRAEELVRRLASEQETDSAFPPLRFREEPPSVVQYDSLEDGAGQSPAGQCYEQIMDDPSIREPLIDEGFGGGRNVGGGAADFDAMPGFWRPNVLY